MQAHREMQKLYSDCSRQLGKEECLHNPAPASVTHWITDEIALLSEKLGKLAADKRIMEDTLLMRCQRLAKGNVSSEVSSTDLQSALVAASEREEMLKTHMKEIELQAHTAAEDQIRSIQQKHLEEVNFMHVQIVALQAKQQDAAKEANALQVTWRAE